MDKKTLESKSISDLKEIASSLGLSDTESLKKAELIGKILGGGSEEKSKDLFNWTRAKFVNGACKVH